VFVPSLTVTEYIPEAGAVPVAETDPVAEPEASVVIPGYPPVVIVTHPSGTPGEPVTVRAVFGLKPLTDKNDTTLAVPLGAYATPELVEPTPNDIVTVGVIVNEAVATSPRLSVTVIIWAPAAKFASAAEVIENMNAEVPCSVTDGDAGTSGDNASRGAAFPILTEATVAPGPNPAKTAVTAVPTGPEVGDRATVGALRAHVAVATLPKLSVNVNEEPVVIPGRLTVPT